MIPLLKFIKSCMQTAQVRFINTERQSKYILVLVVQCISMMDKKNIYEKFFFFIYASAKRLLLHVRYVNRIFATKYTNKKGLETYLDFFSWHQKGPGLLL